MVHFESNLIPVFKSLTEMATASGMRGDTQAVGHGQENVVAGTDLVAGHRAERETGKQCGGHGFDLTVQYASSRPRHRRDPAPKAGI